MRPNIIAALALVLWGAGLTASAEPNRSDLALKPNQT